MPVKFMKSSPTPKPKPKGTSKTIATNKEGLYNYEIIETYQAGLVLSGPEVKAAKLGQMSLKGAYISFDSHNEAWLVKAYITPYKPAKGAQEKYDPSRKRKLLLHKKEIDSLMGKSKQKDTKNNSFSRNPARHSRKFRSANRLTG